MRRKLVCDVKYEKKIPPGLSPRSAYLLNIAVMDLTLGPLELLRENLPVHTSRPENPEDQATKRSSSSSSTHTRARIRERDRK